MSSDTTISARVPSDLRDDVLELARRCRLRESDVVRQLLRAGVNRELGRSGLGSPGSLFDPDTPRARAGDPETSQRAARPTRPQVPRRENQCGRILRIIAAAPVGLTTDEVIRELEQEAHAMGTQAPAVNGVARRVTDLLQGLYVAVRQVNVGTEYEGDETRPTRHGTQALVWVATPKGLAKLRDLDRGVA